MPRDEIPANTYAQSLAAVLAACRALEAEQVGFRDSAGRILAEPLLALADDPAASKSAMDGFALRAADTHGASTERPLRFRYEEVVAAGHMASKPLARGSATRIMTGALLPESADAVVKLEDTQRIEGDGTVERGEFTIVSPVSPGENVLGPGSRFARGDALVPAGIPVSPQALGLTAGQGVTAVNVVRKPRVALLALGDELVEPGRPLRPGQIYVSNLHALDAEARSHGANVTNLGISPDDPDAIAERLEPCLTGAASSDLVITLGGSHRGDFDFAGDIFGRLGARLVFQRTLINWGGSALFATREREGGVTLCFGLPGTPLASWLAFELLVRPAIWKMGGRADTARRILRARLDAPLKLRPGRSSFIPTQLVFAASGLPRAIPLVEKPSADQPTGLLADGLIQCPGGVERMNAGDEISVAWFSG